MMGEKAFWDSSKEISAVLKKIVQGIFSHTVTVVAALLQMTKHVSSYLQKKAHQMNLFYIMIQVTGTYLVSYSMIFMT